MAGPRPAGWAVPAGHCVPPLGPRLPERERSETGEQLDWSPTPLPGLGAAHSLLDGMEGQWRWQHSARGMAPACLSRTIAVPTSQMRKPKHSTSQRVRVDPGETPRSRAHPHAPHGLLFPGAFGIHPCSWRGTGVTATQHRPAPITVMPPPPASRAPPASAGSRAHPQGTGRPATGGLAVDYKGPRGTSIPTWPQPL